MDKKQDIVELIGKIDKWGTVENDPERPDMLKIGDTALCKLRFRRGDEVYITYYISDVELTKEKFEENRLLTIIGSPSINYNHIYGTELTGYMWTDENFKVGNHDLYEELKSYDSKYCYLKIYNTL